MHSAHMCDIVLLSEALQEQRTQVSEKSWLAKALVHDGELDASSHLGQGLLGVK